MPPLVSAIRAGTRQKGSGLRVVEEMRRAFNSVYPRRRLPVAFLSAILCYYLGAFHSGEAPMKQCPACQAQYADETLSFCLQDGTPLVAGSLGDTPTVVLGETETFVARGPNQRGSHAWQPSEVTRVQGFERPAPKSGSKTAIAIVLTAAGMLLLFGVIGVAALLYMNSGGSVVTNANTNINRPPTNLNANLFDSNAPAATPVRPSPTPVASPKASPKPTVEEPPPPRELARYPSTTRLRFARGAFTTSFSGDLNPGDQRSLVLACRPGQSLSASLSGGGSCVSIRGGGSTYRTTTSWGDNYVTITNRCSEVARFSISITVI
jgi:hypothetical protein